MHEPQYRYIARNPEKYKEYARNHYHRVQADPERAAKRKEVRTRWYAENKESVLQKQKEKKRARKQDAISYLGGACKECNGEFHPAVFEFHHRDPATKDRDPSKLLQLKWERVKEELDKCDLLCANCHRLIHHNWE